MLNSVKYIIKSYTDEDHTLIESECDDVFKLSFTIQCVFYYLSISWTMQAANMTIIVLVNVSVLAILNQECLERLSGVIIGICMFIGILTIKSWTDELELK